MPALIQYLLNLSLSLTILYLFYQLLLRRLTFYQHNRVFLLGYSLLSFLIPIINISPILEKHSGTRGDWIQQFPSVQSITTPLSDPVARSGYELNGYWDWLMLLLITGVVILITRLLVQLISFRKIRNRSTLISGDSIQLYQVDKDIIPFSFGKSIYINQHLHSAEELREIVRHEFVHVKQLHTIDIIWSELLCVINWYNPFAWLIRKAIRQNLEFIADNKVVEAGVDKKQYQYLLLKVIGNNHYSITNQFNFSSLKKRIAMMNKIKTSKVQFLRLLLLLPAVTILLLAFRQNQHRRQEPVTRTLANQVAPAVVDTPPLLINEKGYNISIRDKQGNCQVVIKDKDNKVVKTLLLTEWQKKENYYEDLYGEIPPPPPPVPPVPPTPAEIAIAPIQGELSPIVAEPVPPLAPVSIEKMPIPPVPPAPAKVKKLPENVKGIRAVNEKVEVELKDGKVEKYDLSKPEEKAAFEKKYGKMPEPPQPPPVPVEVNDKGYTLSIINNNQGDCMVVVANKAMEVRKVLLLEWNQRRGYFEDKYGEIPPLPAVEKKAKEPVSPLMQFWKKPSEGC